MTPSKPVARTRPEGGNQAYVSDYRERTTLTFLRFFESKQRSGTFVAAVKESTTGRDRWLQLDDDADIALFRDRLVPDTVVDVQGIGQDRHSMRILVWLDGERIDDHTFVTGQGKAPTSAVDWEHLRRTYRNAFESALQVRDSLEVNADKAEFSVNEAAAALFHRAMVARPATPRSSSRD